MIHSALLEMGKHLDALDVAQKFEGNIQMRSVFLSHKTMTFHLLSMSPKHLFFIVSTFLSQFFHSYELYTKTRQKQNCIRALSILNEKNRMSLKFSTNNFKMKKISVKFTPDVL